MMVAVTPGLPLAVLIAEAMPASVSLLLVILTLKLLLPRLTCNVPVPTVVVPVPVNLFDRSCCAEASCETVTLYDPIGAPELAVAVNAAVLLLVAVSALKAFGVSSALKEAWNVDNAPLSVPSAEIWVVTVCVWAVIRFCCGTCVAVTSCWTNALTLMTEPPAAPALVLLATETGLDVAVVEVMRIYSLSKKCEGGRRMAPALPYDDECFKLVVHQLTAASGEAS